MSTFLRLCLAQLFLGGRSRGEESVRPSGAFYKGVVGGSIGEVRGLPVGGECRGRRGIAARSKEEGCVCDTYSNALPYVSTYFNYSREGKHLPL